MFPLSEIAVGLLSVKCVLYISVLNKDVAEQWATIIANKRRFFGGFTFSFNRHNCSALCQGGAFYASAGLRHFFCWPSTALHFKNCLGVRRHFIDHTFRVILCFIVQPGEFWQSPTPPLYFNWRNGRELPPAAAMCSCDSSQMEDTVFGWKKASK